MPAKLRFLTYPGVIGSPNDLIITAKPTQGSSVQGEMRYVMGGKSILLDPGGSQDGGLTWTIKRLAPTTIDVPTGGAYQPVPPNIKKPPPTYSLDLTAVATNPTTNKDAPVLVSATQGGNPVLAVWVDEHGATQTAKVVQIAGFALDIFLR